MSSYSEEHLALGPASQLLSLRFFLFLSDSAFPVLYKLYSELLNRCESSAPTFTPLSFRCITAVVQSATNKGWLFEPAPPNLNRGNDGLTLGGWGCAPVCGPPGLLGRRPLLALVQVLV